MICICMLAGALALNGQSPLRSVTEGVYSSGQAARGQLLYREQCAECHGNAMEGTIGPPLAGDSFLAAWSARPLSNLAEKIQKTMPFNRTGTLNMQQAGDLVAYILQVGKFPPGQRELNDATLAQ